MSKYLNIKISNQQVEVKDNEDVPIAITYQLEDPENFQNKKSSEAFDVIIPATLNNDKLANSFHNPSVEDLTDGEVFKSHQSAVIESGGVELLSGKAFLVNAVHTTKPENCKYNFYGNNADWLIDVKETTLYDILKRIQIPYTKAAIQASWNFDGTNENMPYVFAPIRYRGVFDMDNNKDDNVSIKYLRPSISVYWTIYWAFQSLGYKIQSDFMQTPYFRRLVMPWVWGNFLSSEGSRQKAHAFLAKSVGDQRYSFLIFDGYLDLKVSNDSTAGAYDNNDDYRYDSANYAMIWRYKNNFDFKTLSATFSLQISVELSVSDVSVIYTARWFKNGSLYQENDIGSISVGYILPPLRFRNIFTHYSTVIVNPGDEISVKIYMKVSPGRSSLCVLTSNVLAFKFEYFKIPIGGTILFDAYTGLKNYKFVDFFRGIIDCFNLSIQTDNVNKMVCIEPTHAYSLTADVFNTKPGYFNGDYLDWNDKQDLSKDSTLSLFSDYEREVIFKFKDDDKDGILKIVQDRYITTLAASKYVFPDRFKTGKKEHENRFFSPVMHYTIDQFKAITGIAPQMICIIPENISNTSNTEAINTFNPKLAYYKGNVTGAGGWKFDGTNLTTYPFLFAVNYGAGGENDPVLSYSDERIGEGANIKIAFGLLKRFFWQRLAIMRNGQYYSTYFRLDNYDVTNWFHREHIICRGQKWELVKISNYKPLQQQSTLCELRKWSPISAKDNEATYPTTQGIIDGSVTANNFDIKYVPLKCLITDIPI